MQIKAYLRPRNLTIIILLLFAVHQNHLSVRFFPSELCMTAEFIGEPPSECDGYRLTGPHLYPWHQAVVKELEKDSVPTVSIIALRDRTIFVVDAILILLAILSIKPKAKQP